MATVFLFSYEKPEMVQPDHIRDTTRKANLDIPAPFHPFNHETSKHRLKKQRAKLKSAAESYARP